MDNIDDTYQTVSSPAQGLYKDRASRFVSFVFPVDSEEEVKDILKSLRKKYYDATHHCYAYAIGINRALNRQNDDGEPSGTAGKPIFGQILSHKLSNILIVVVRYFGGTKLGVSGLINAYREAASDALAHAGVISKTLNETFIIGFDYSDSERVMKAIKKDNARVLEQKYEDKCVIHLEIRQRDAMKLKEALKEFLK